MGVLLSAIGILVVAALIILGVIWIVENTKD